MTKDEAYAARAALFNDAAWYALWQAGDAEAKAKFDTITKAIVGTPEAWDKHDPDFGRQGDGKGHEIFPGSPNWRGNA